MTERADQGASTSGKPPRPRSVEFATIAVGAQLLFAVVYAGLSWGFTAPLRKFVIDANNRAAHPKPLCNGSGGTGCYDVTKELHNFRLQTTQSTVLIAVLIVLLTVMFRRGSGAGRWIYIVLSVVGSLLGFAGTPLQVLEVTSSLLPKAMGAVVSLSGLAAIVAIVLLIVPTSAKWFREMKLLTNPGAAQRPVGLGALFAPRRPAARPAPQRAPGRAAANTPGAAANPARAKSKAKVRADADAVAKGAELARSRAKANKSRRTD